MNIVRPSKQSKSTDKKIQSFINDSIGYTPTTDLRQMTFFNQSIYNYATKIAHKSPQSVKNSDIDFHYTVDLQNKTEKNNQINQLNKTTIHKNFLKTDRSGMRWRSNTSRVSDNPQIYQTRKDSFNSVLKLNEMNKSMRKNSWLRSDYEFKCADRKQQYAVFDNYNKQLYNTKVFFHNFRDSSMNNLSNQKDFDLIIRKKKKDLTKVSLLDNANYINYDKYDFPKKIQNKKQKKPMFFNPNDWKKHYHHQSLIQNAKTSLIYHKPDQLQKLSESQMKLIHIPIKPSQKILFIGQQKPKKQKKNKPHSNKFISYNRGIFQLLYPKTINKFNQEGMSK